MKKTKKLFEGIALIAVIGFMPAVLSLTGCDNGSGNGGGGNAPSTNGRLTFSGLEAYNGKYVYAQGGENVYLIAAENANVVTYSVTGSRISNGSVTLKVWQYAETNELLDYSGNNQNVKFHVEIYDNANVSQNNAVAFTEVSVNFNSGIGSGVCNNILPAEKEFTITIKNSSSYPITAYGVKTEAGLAGPKYDIAYTSADFDGNSSYFSIEDYTTKINMPRINITAGATSNNLGPFKVVFRGDRANPSDIYVVINYLDGTTKGTRWSESPSSTSDGRYSGYWQDDVPGNFALVFNGTSLEREVNAPETNWWTWVSTKNDGNYISTASISITPNANDSGCNVIVSGIANPKNNSWATHFGYNYTATVGKKYKVAWKWQANEKPFQSVSIRLAQQKDYQDTPEYFLVHYENALTIPTSEESKMYEFTMPGYSISNFSFFVGEDIGSFEIRDFKFEEVTP